MRLSDLHVDECTVYRAVSQENEYGALEEKYEKLYENIPCRLSQKVLRSVSVGDNNSSSQEYKLFTDLGADIRQNDKLVITRYADGSQYFFKASKPMSYRVIRHKEIVLTEISGNEVMK
ncbi:YqbH/XkdH family protein [Fusobacterium necrophorum]|uniref:YqbH/XkdH family protein n=1 Tax=Fusobacterium necrophorum TaxID=859 RepID=A0AAW6WDG3_9FUSO|nr:hypothetical protein [Fusobacterium necrophorum]MDK4481720.1 YqbH/XkdH family protein [Fusobacterium necrophorum]MDK4512861.1 YqbH/XkdH family protein [Fusobacterium necrophorum]MDK4515659.1 YqbH/XkdH family protein [Fusobacterium necrophorum]